MGAGDGRCHPVSREAGILNPFVLLLVVALAAGGLAMAGVLRLNLATGGVVLAAGPPGRARKVRLDLREGLLADICLFFVVLDTAALVANSNWVPGSGILLPMMAVGAAVAFVLAKVAPRGTTYWLAVEVGAVVALFLYAAPHAGDPVSDFVAWVRGIRGSVNLAALVTMAGAGWMVVAWSMFWVARRRNAALALSPLAVILAIEIINDPVQPGNGALMVFWLLLAGTLLLRLNAARIHDRWHDLADSQVWVSIATRGALAVIVILVIAIVLPPLSTVDLSVGMFHGRSPTGGDGPPNSAVSRSQSQPVPNLTQTGYSERVAPGGTLVRSNIPVLQASNSFGRQVYWRGINLYSVVGGVWSPGLARAVTVDAAANTLVDPGSDLARQNVRATVNVLDVPQTTIFWPGEPVLVNQATILRSSQGGSLGGVASVEAAYARSAVPVGQSYVVQASQSVATEDQLRGAGTIYPPEVTRLTGLRPGGGAPLTVINQSVADLARSVAGSGTPYDQVSNIEKYLRTKEKYQLKVAAPPPNADPINYFLFTTHTGYCEYFASSMGEMVRALGIPVRLVSGYGPGTSTQPQDITPNFKHEVGAGAIVTTIHASDAHTWVEVYFPSYGWVPFEPTPDPNYPELTRGTSAAPNPATTAPATVPQVIAPPVPHRATNAGIPVPVALGLTFTAILAVAAILFLLARLAVGAGQWDLGLAWSRLGWLGRRLGVPRRPTDTPLEFASRLSGQVPELADEIMLLGAAYSRAAYSPNGPRDGEREREAAAWARVRGRLVRLLALGVRPGEAAPQS